MQSNDNDNRLEKTTFKIDEKSIISKSNQSENQV